MDTYYFTAKCFTQLQLGLPQSTFVDATSLVNYVRIIKSDKEIEYIRRAARIVENAMQTGIDAIEEGVRECDVVAKIMHAQISGTVEFGGDYPAIMPLLPSGERTSTPHLTWTDEKYKSEVEAVWRKSIAKSGFEKESRIGYSMGLNYPPDWGEHTASLRPGDKTVLQPNMTFHCIPGIWLDEYGVELSESFR
ncbi:Creatinase/aminopeptidase, partial [Rhizophagus irregularis]